MAMSSPPWIAARHRQSQVVATVSGGNRRWNQSETPMAASAGTTARAYDPAQSGEGRPQIARTKSQACSTEAARKNNQPSDTTERVSNQPTAEGIRRPRPTVDARHSRKTPSATPWHSPHTTKVQFAPCHKPANRNVTRTWAKVRAAPFRSPPSGRYT